MEGSLAEVLYAPSRRRRDPGSAVPPGVGTRVTRRHPCGVRPVLRRKMAQNDRSNEVESNPRMLAGRTATVEEAVDGHSGLVRLSGELWSARALVPGTTFGQGDRVTVVSIDGNTAVVDKEV